ncbi:MAG: hypothetical protein ACREMY_26680 [bacterium]
MPSPISPTQGRRSKAGGTRPTALARTARSEIPADDGRPDVSVDNVLYAEALGFKPIPTRPTIGKPAE